MKKEKNIKEDVPQTPEQATSSVRSYFTKEILDQMAEMGGKEMESLLKEMVDTRQFIAILKYTSMRTPLLDATLRGTDPIKDPSKISWAQGAMAGLCDLETYIVDLNVSKQEEGPQEEGSENRIEGTI